MPTIGATSLAVVTLSAPYRGRATVILGATALMFGGGLGVGSAAETDQVTKALAETALAAREPVAVAYLRVRKTSSQTEEAYVRHRQTQIELIKSPFVFAAALRLPGVAALKCIEAENDPVEWLARTIEVEAPRDSEIVRIRVRGIDVRQAYAVVNAVTEAYLSRVISTEKAERFQRCDALERIYKENMDELRNSLNVYHQMARELGARDSPKAATRKALLLDRLRSFREQITRMEIDRSAVETDIGVAQKVGQQPDPKLAARLAVLEEQIRKITKEADGIIGEVEHLPTANADLDVKWDRIQHLQTTAKQLAIEWEASRLDIKMPYSVELIEKATVPSGVE